MSEKKQLLACCGMYCGDCLGYTGIIADAAMNFKTILDKYKFRQSAECILPEPLPDFREFEERLAFMTGLRCPQVCRERQDDAIGSAVRKCCMGRGYFACHECDDLDSCDKLPSLYDGLHYEAWMKNLKAIREIGLDAWLESGPRHHYWDDSADAVARNRRTV